MCQRQLLLKNPYGNSTWQHIVFQSLYVYLAKLKLLKVRHVLIPYQDLSPFQNPVKQMVPSIRV